MKKPVSYIKNWLKSNNDLKYILMIGLPWLTLWILFCIWFGDANLY